MKRACAIVALLLFAGNWASAADNPPRMEWKVDGVAREALVYAPATAKTGPSPVAFAFHGHGGNMKYAATKFAYHKHWPEVIHSGGHQLPDEVLPVIVKFFKQQAKL
jgi:hypothetical protein